MFEKTFFSLSEYFGKRAGISRSNTNYSTYQYLVDKPAWLSLSNAHDYRQAVQNNPVLYGCIDILASAAANGRKYLVGPDGKEIPWTSKKPAIQNARKLFVDGPNPIQSVKEFNYEGYYMFFTFGNNYVLINNPLSSFDSDITNVQAMYNLPSEFVKVKQTGKIYDQIDLRGIIEYYALTDRTPIEPIDPDKIIHFNDLNLSGIGTSIIGTSRLENLKMPITNTQLAFEAMNVILKSRGMQGIISANSKDQQGSQVPLPTALKDDIDKTFRTEYGLLDNQKTFLVTYADINYIKTIMNSQELGIYEEFSNNAMIISNGLKVPVELYKTYTQGATFENQIQAVRRLYQDTVIPHVENQDQYYTKRLKMRDYGFELRTDFSHIQALQEAFREKATALNLNVSAADKAYTNNIITMNQYLIMIGEEPIGPEGDIYKKDRDKTTTA